MTADILLIDNFDSFTFNLMESLRRLGRGVRVVRNRVDPDWAVDFASSEGAAIVISPGPGTPRDAGRCLEIVARAKGRVPLLGICLGHQAIVEQAGGRISEAPQPVHGKASLLDHDGGGPFAGIEQPIRIGRYHSLCTRDVPSRFHVHGEIDGMAMAIADPAAMQVGLQFHPESILTSCGEQILSNVLRHWREPASP